MGMAQLGNRLYTGESSFDFVGRKKLWFLIAAALVLVSAVLLWKPGLTFGIEFEGGSEFRVTGSANQDAAREAVQAVVPGSEPTVTSVGQNGVRVQTETLTSGQLDRGRLWELSSARRPPVPPCARPVAWPASLPSRCSSPFPSQRCRPRRRPPTSPRPSSPAR